MTAFRIRGPVHPAAQAEISALASRSSVMIFGFAEIEVLIAGWLWKLFVDPNEALRFLSKTTAIGKRIDKLIALLGQESASGHEEFVAELKKVDDYRELRNALVHGVPSHSGTFVRFITWKGNACISTHDLDKAICEINILAIKIFNAYTVRYGSHMDLNFVASRTPPPTTEQ
ncbi:MAG: hypothetical protein HYX63_03295 [Gammaproteobacteria bacterium]|nr:hypothetical protein [Gammaproteobacteria bacterium]